MINEPVFRDIDRILSEENETSQEAQRLREITNKALETKRFDGLEWLKRYKNKILTALQDAAALGDFHANLFWSDFGYPDSVAQKVLFDYLESNGFDVITDFDYGMKVHW